MSGWLNPTFPRCGQGYVCPACFEVVKQPDVHWTEAHDGETEYDLARAAEAARKADGAATIAAGRTHMSATQETPEQTPERVTPHDPQEVTKKVAAALKRAGVKVEDLDPAQLARAVDAPIKHAGLMGKALVEYVETGKNAKQQQEEARMAREVKEGEAKAKAAASDKRKDGKATKRADAYPADVRDAVKLVYDIKGSRNGAPGPKQHQHVRTVVAGKLKVKPDAVTKQQIVEVSGYKSAKALRAVASGEAGREDLKVLRELAGEMGEDQFCKGRNLAAILTAWYDQK